MKDHFKAIFCSYAEIFFFQSGWLGALIFVMTLVNPFVALCGILSVVAAYLFARFIRMETVYLESGYYTYNPLLVGLSLGYILDVTPLMAFFVISAGILAFMSTILMANIFTTYLRLPILSLPFVVCSSLTYLASRRYSNLLVAWESRPSYTPKFLSDLFSHLPIWLTGYFESFGAILFLPSVLVGLVFSGLVLGYSRILFFLSVLGYYVGTGVRALLLGSSEQAFGDIASFNFILIAMAVGGVFLIPSPRSYLIATVAVVVSILILDSIEVFMSYYTIPAFTLPFNIASLGFIYVLGLLKYAGIAQYVGATPEETLENHLADKLRYHGEQQRTLHLPFSGPWTVWQGFDSGWTHKAKYKYAYDFVIADEEGNNYRDAGENLEDFYCFDRPVLSPIRGRVIRIINNLPDNPIGQVDEANNWGNLVILEDPRGFHVEISHLVHESIEVNEGDWVERGTILGRCGNSGYSPQPHLHIQVQASDKIGAETLPFSFVSFIDGNSYFANDLPDEKKTIEPLFIDKRLDSVTTFLLDDVLKFEVLQDGELIDVLEVEVKNALDGTFYFESSQGRLYFGKHEGTFYFYRVEGRDRWLPLLFLALPRLPLAHKPGMSWSDFVPVGLTTTGFQRVMARFASAFLPDFARVQVNQKFRTSNVVEAVIRPGTLQLERKAEVTLDTKLGLASVKIDNTELRRKKDEE
ncbi:MAG: urea transporter [Planctomycetota bacterium]|jgi:urea transporter|nr:urea transporter [Planctomycetota bacterium]